MVAAACSDLIATVIQGTPMPKYVIERDIAGAGQLTAADLQGISAKSCAVLRDLGPSLQWVQCTNDKCCAGLSD